MNLINDKRYWSRSKDWNSRFKKFLKRSYNKDFDVSRFLKSKTKTRFFEPRFSFCFCSHFTPCFTIKYELRRFFQNHGSELYTGWWKEWRGNGNIMLSKSFDKDCENINLLSTIDVEYIFKAVSRCFKCTYWCNWDLISYFIIYIDC